MTGLKMIGQVSAFAVSAAMGTVVVGAIGVIVAYSVLTAIIPADDKLWGDARCYLGVPLQTDSACIQDQLSRALKEQEAAHQQREQEMVQKISALETEKGHLETARRGFEQKLETLESMEAKVSTFTLFTRKPWRTYEVTSGVNYTSFVKDQAWSKAWCYVSITTLRGLPLHIQLATQEPGKLPDASDPEAAVREEARFSVSDIAEARSHCQLPPS
jgi:hypothetical protein